MASLFIIGRYALTQNLVDRAVRVPEKGVLSMERRGARLGILVIATTAVEIPRLLAFLPEGRSWVFTCETIGYGLMAGLPLVLVRIAPEAAGFDRQWLPSARSHWGWFLGMILLLFLGGGIATWFSGFPTRAFYSSYGSIRPVMVLVSGIIMVFVAPIAEEIFWRAYFLEQLRRVTYTSVSLLSHSVLFALSHLRLLHQGPVFLLAVLWYGTILGIWRIRFRSILPLMFAHVILNVVAVGPVLKTQYDDTANLWSKPHVRKVESLTRERIPKAVPAIIAFLADPDDDVRGYATMTLLTRYRGDAQRFLKDALASSDTNLINGVLLVVEIGRFSGLREEVRRVAWSINDRGSQLAATLTLHGLGDVEGLREISQRHPDEIVRRTAQAMLAEESGMK